MKLFALTLANGRNLLSAGLYPGLLVVWFGTRPLCFDLTHADAFRPAGRAGW